MWNRLWEVSCVVSVVDRVTVSRLLLLKNANIWEAIALMWKCRNSPLLCHNLWVCEVSTPRGLNFAFLWSVGYLIIIIIIEVIIFWIIVFVFEQLWLSRVKYAFLGVICPARTSRPMLCTYRGLGITEGFFSSPFLVFNDTIWFANKGDVKKMHQLSKVALHTESART